MRPAAFVRFVRLVRLVGFVAVVAAPALLASCTSAAPLASAPSLASLSPQTLLPGSTLVIRGSGFTGDDSTLRIVGTASGAPFDRTWSATLVDAQTLTVALGASLDAADLLGTATVTDGGTTSDPLPVSLSLRASLTPSIATLQTGAIFVDDAIALTGDGFLLGGAEGTTVALVTGCVSRGGGCEPVAPRSVPLIATSRTRATFAFAPSIAGVAPGTFTGTVALANGALGSAPVPVVYDLVPPQVVSLSPASVSLGQYVVIRGGGFAGVTQLALAGSLAGTPIDLVLVPEVVSGRLARYVVDTDDALGHALDLRTQTGRFTGTVTPIVTYGDQRAVGSPVAVSLDLAAVTQVVYLNVTASFVAELSDFGLRGLDGPIRDRILAVIRDAYRGVNIDLRTSPPADFARYTQIDLVGVDPNAEGLLGYDAGPTKDDGNARLDDRLGGVSSAVQPDGFPGFGGVFLRSVFAFSTHPRRSARSPPSPIRCSTRSSIRCATTPQMRRTSRPSRRSRRRARVRRTTAARRSRAASSSSATSSVTPSRTSWGTRSASRTRTPTASTTPAMRRIASWMRVVRVRSASARSSAPVRPASAPPSWPTSARSSPPPSQPR